MPIQQRTGIVMKKVPVLLFLFLVFPPAVQSRLTTFHIIQKKMTQTEALTACRTNYTDLVTLYSEEDNTELVKMLPANNTKAWIGLYRGQSSDKWSNGDDVTFSSETGDCGTGVCCTAMKPDGSWERLNCTDTRPFMCYEEDDSCSPIIYHVVNENKSWYDAQRYCRKNYTDLVSIRDQQQNEEVKIKGGNSTSSFWIGLLHDDWEWRDGGRSAYRNWRTGQPRPSSSSSSDCVYLFYGQWNSVPCSNQCNAALCSHSNILDSRTPSHSFSTVFPPAVQSRLTTFHIIQKKMTQTEALTACRTNYTDLVTLYSEEDNTELVNMMTAAGIRSGWIGLYRGQSSDKWSNGDDVTFSSETGDCGTGVCCTAMKPDGSWERLNCRDTRPFMCYEEDGRCSLFIYHIIYESKSWYDAQRYCRKNYTDLVSIRDQQQNEEVKIKGGNSTTSFWIGLLRDDWEWSDEANSSYRNCGCAETRPSGCVKMRGGKWISAACSDSDFPLCYRTSVHVSEERMSWERALQYCQQENRTALLRIENHAEKKELKLQLRRKRVRWPVWVGLGQGLISELLASSSRLAVGPWRGWDAVRQTQAEVSHSNRAAGSEGRATDVSQLRAVCEVKPL